jgi:hypothetical protein
MSYNISHFGVKQSLNKAERSLISKIKKEELMIEAIELGLMVDNQLTKPQLFNLIKQRREELNPKSKMIDTEISMRSLFDSLPSVERVPLNVLSDTKYRDTIYSPIVSSGRLPPGSKNILKEQGLTKTQKTIVRKEIKNEIDRLTELLENL